MGLELCDDPTTLKTLIDLHAPPASPLFGRRILDLTHETGKMWRGLEYVVERLDLNPSLDVDYYGDFRDLRHLHDRHGDPIAIADASVEILVVDPPHRTESGVNSVFAKRFGLLSLELAHKANIGELFPPLLSEAARVLRPGGILLAKIGDQVHNGHRQWQPMLFWQAATAQEGLTVCDVRWQERPEGEGGSFPYDGEVYHLLTNYVAWFVVRRGTLCRRATR